jgi:hypothetical protein
MQAWSSTAWGFANGLVDDKEAQQHIQKQAGGLLSPPDLDSEEQGGQMNRQQLGK